MMIFHCQAKSISRAAGRSATAAAAYRSGERITDERTGEIHDYRKKRGILQKQLFLPQGVRSVSRAALWNMAEAAENRKDAKVAREWEVALPAELSARDRMYLAQHFARAIVERYGVAVDMCIHAPGKKGDDRNHHVHFLTSTRVLKPDGFGEKTRVLDSPRTSGKEVTAVREIWERLCNRALELEFINERIDRRTLKAQGINRVATQHLGPIAASMERLSKRSMRGDYLRDRNEANKLAEQLAALRKIDNGVAAAKDRHASRKEQTAERAERSQRERDVLFWANVQGRKSNNRGMGR